MAENKKHFEVVVIGAGPGGYAAAFRAADLGKQVLMIDRDPNLGGVCLNRGCIPSKALLHIAKVMDDAADLKKMGVVYEKPSLDLNGIRGWKNKVVNQLTRGLDQLAKVRKVETLKGSAVFNSDVEISVKTENGDLTVTFDACIIAAGSRSTLIPGTSEEDSYILTSRSALELEDIPNRLLVIGGGVIGLELGSVFATLGSNVSVVELMPQLIPEADQDLVKPLERKLKKQFEAIHKSSKVTKVEKNTDSTATVSIDTGKEEIQESFDKVLVSVGRRPNTDILKIENTSIATNKGGFINVDKTQRTSVKNIYAIGDIAGEPQLAHKATHEGHVAAEVIAGEKSAFDAKAIPAVVFTDPEVAWAGLTEKEAKEKNIPYEKGEVPWAASGKALAIGRNEGKTKFLFDPETKQVLGVGIVGPEAGNLISEAMLAIEMGADAEDIGLTIHPHPTLGETTSLAAEVFEGTVTDLYAPQK